MGIIRNYHKYTAARIGWTLVTWGGFFIAISRNSRPTESQLGVFLVTAGIAWLGGFLVIGYLRIRDWRRSGAESNLTLEGHGLFTYPDLTGTIRGRSVRASIVKGGKQKYTLVQADLSHPAADGIIVGPSEGDRVQGYEFGETVDVIDDKLAAIGGSETARQAVVSGRTREALLAVDRLNLVYVGDASDASEKLERQTTLMSVDARVDETMDTSTVFHLARGVLNADELDRQVEAVVAVAEAFENATPASQPDDEG